MSSEKVQCCPPDRIPALDVPKDYKKAGSEIKLGGLTAYVSGEAKKGAIIVVHDILGPRTGRHFGVCDTFAAAGYYTIMPMIFEKGVTMGEIGKDPMYNLMKKHPVDDIKTKIGLVLDHLAEKKIASSATGIVGFCWGSWCVWQTSANFGSKIGSGACFHPAIIEGLFGGKIDDLADKIQNPLLVAPCKGDPAELQVGGSVSKILAKKSFGKDMEYVDCSHLFHGFVTQGDTSDKEMAASVNKALGSAISFFGKTLKA